MCCVPLARNRETNGLAWVLVFIPSIKKVSDLVSAHNFANDGLGLREIQHGFKQAVVPVEHAKALSVVACG
jgi:hypothetical protein